MIDKWSSLSLFSASHLIVHIVRPTNKRDPQKHRETNDDDDDDNDDGEEQKTTKIFWKQLNVDWIVVSKQNVIEQ